MKLPSLSIVIPTFNSSKTLVNCLKSVKDQNYPTKLIEIIISDGGSTDNTFSIAKKRGAKIVKVKNTKKQGPEYNRAYGAHKATNVILVFLDHDNILPHKNWLKKMVKPFIDEKKVIGAETTHYHYDKKDTHHN